MKKHKSTDGRQRQVRLTNVYNFSISITSQLKRTKISKVIYRRLSDVLRLLDVLRKAVASIENCIQHENAGQMDNDNN